jgi:hypothetical protein
VYDASAQPNAMGAKNMTVVKRTAKPAIETTEWRDTQRTATRTTVHDNRLVVFRNQEQVPSFSGWETCSPSVSINEFGLLDGVLHLKKLVSDESQGSGGSGTTGSKTLKYSFDINCNVSTKNVETGNPEVAVLAKTVDVKEKRFWGTDPILFVREYNKSESRPDLGLVPHMANVGGVRMLITYSEIKVKEYGTGKTFKVVQRVPLDDGR